VELKHNNETFTHGVAPLSFSWNCSDFNILKPYLSSKVENSASHSRPSSITLRDNSKNIEKKVFATKFNSSSIYTKAVRSGEAILSVQMAIAYPNKYRES